VFAFTFYNNVTGIESPLRPFLEVMTSPPALSYRDERHETLYSITRKRRRIKLRTPHIPMHRLIYESAIESVSPSGQITCTNKATDLHVAGPKPIAEPSI